MKCEKCGVDFCQVGRDQLCVRCIENEPSGEIIMNNELKVQIKNNFKYHEPKEGQPATYKLIRDYGKEMATVIDSNCPASREKSIAMTKLEEAVMWANASIARNE